MGAGELTRFKQPSACSQVLSYPGMVCVTCYVAQARREYGCTKN